MGAHAWVHAHGCMRICHPSHAVGVLRLYAASTHPPKPPHPLPSPPRLHALRKGTQLRRPPPMHEGTRAGGSSRGEEGLHEGRRARAGGSSRAGQSYQGVLPRGMMQKRELSISSTYDFDFFPEKTNPGSPSSFECSQRRSLFLWLTRSPLGPRSAASRPPRKTPTSGLSVGGLCRRWWGRLTYMYASR